MLGRVKHTCNPVTQATEAGGSRPVSSIQTIGRQAELHCGQWSVISKSFNQLNKICNKIKAQCSEVSRVSFPFPHLTRWIPMRERFSGLSIFHYNCYHHHLEIQVSMSFWSSSPLSCQDCVDFAWRFFLVLCSRMRSNALQFMMYVPDSRRKPPPENLSIWTVILIDSLNRIRWKQWLSLQLLSWWLIWLNSWKKQPSTKL